MTRTPRSASAGRLRVAVALALLGASAIAGVRASAQTRPPGTAATTPPAPRDAPVAPDLALATFDSAWTIIRRSHYDSAMRGIDWSAVRTELRPRAEAAATLGDLRRVIGDMLDRLGESHFGLIPREVADAFDPEALRVADDDTAGVAERDSAATGAGAASRRAGRDTTRAGGRRGGAAKGTEVPGDVGVSLRLIGREVVVSAVERGGPAARAGVRPGWVLQAVDGFTAERGRRALAQLTNDAERREAVLRLPMAVEQLLAGPTGSDVRVTFRNAAGRPVTLSLRRRRTPGEPVKFGNLPTLFARLTSEQLPGAGGCVGVIRFNVWMTPIAPEFDRAMDELRGCRGLVLDLRGNLGGIAGMVMGVAGYFLDEQTPLGFMRSRGTELRFVANPRRVNARGEPIRPYEQPLAIIVDRRSVSTSEIFAAGMQTVGRARIFGDTTAAQALPAVATSLPSGDFLLHVIADFTGPDGRRIEGHGVVPDEATPLTRADLLAGRDRALEAAVRWINRSAAAERRP